MRVPLQAAACAFACALGVAAAQAQRAAPATPPAQQTPQQPRASVEQRAAELRAVVGLVTSPDRDLNVANFEQIMESGDVRRIEIAVRTLVASDDPVMRGLAMRGYIAVTRQLELEVVLPEAQLAVVQQARSAPNGLPSLRGGPHHWLGVLGEQQFRVKLWFERASVLDPGGVVGTVPSLERQRYPHNVTSYVVRGDRITFRLQPWWGAGFVCDFDLRPARDAEIAGVMACIGDRFSSPVQVAAPMF
jgi:hypothetical protein